MTPDQSKLLTSSHERTAECPSDVAAALIGQAGDVERLLSEAFDSWHIDVLALAKLTDNRPLSTLGCYLLERLGLIDTFQLDLDKLRHFLVVIERGYNDSNPYHNRGHAASVMHFMHVYLKHGGLARAIAPAGVSDPGCSRDGQLKQLACLIAAAVHDFEHEGLTNDFLVKSDHERALRYNNQHVNEHHHVAAAMSLMHREQYAFLTGLTLTEKRKLRNMVIDLVLGTDMADNAKILETFMASIAAESAHSSGSPKLENPVDVSAKQEAHATLLMKVALKCSDLGHLALPWDLHLQWVQRLEAEFFAQGDREKALDMNVSFLMDRDGTKVSASQIGFFDFVALPLFRTFTQAAPLTEPALATVLANYERWQMRAATSEQSQL